MSYITAEEYEALTGQPAPSDYAVLSAESDAEIDRQTLFGLWGRNIDALPQPIAQQIKLAAAHQIQYLDQCGGISAINDTMTPGMTLGKYSYSGGAASDGGGSSNVGTSPMLSADLTVVNAYFRGRKNETNP